MLIRHSGRPYVADVAANMDLAERYRLLYQSTGPRAWRSAFDEQARIVAAYRDDDAERAAAELASHLARTALVLIAESAPSYDPNAVSAALAIFDGEIRTIPAAVSTGPALQNGAGASAASRRRR
jgi:hypothetical protein